MGYIRGDDFILKGYLSRHSKAGKTGIRRLSPEEMALIDRLRRQYKEMGFVMAEVMMALRVIRKAKDSRLIYIDRNLNRVLHSLKRQRDLIFATKKALSQMEPIREEWPTIKRLPATIDTRIKFVRETVLKDNLLLTPISEYLEITGRDLKTDMLNEFGDWFGAWKARTEEPERMEEYVNRIIKTVQDAGLYERYQERLESYISVADEREARKQAEYKAEKEAAERKLVEDQMINFHRLFHNSVREVKNCKEVGVSVLSITEAVKEYGRENTWVVLCCYAHKGHPVFRYLTAHGLLERAFAKAGIFASEEEAAEAMAAAQRKWPGRLFDVTKMAYVAEEAG